MYLSKFFSPVLKEKPREAQILSHSYMLQAGFITQSSSGIYTWLPMGLRVINKISNIIREEMNKAGATELLMPILQGADNWKKSNRYDIYGKEMLKISDRHNKELIYGPTNEEEITDIFAKYVQSYKDLPCNLYQIQWKFRDEIRPRFGVMRSREFLLKDSYSFDLTVEDAHITFKKMFAAYLKIFENLGLKAIPMKAENGPIGGNLSFEFIILANNGESEVFFNKEILNNTNLSNVDYNSIKNIENIFNSYTQNHYAVTDEQHNVDDPLFLEQKDDIITQKGIEVGHMFYFSDKYSKVFNASILNKDGKNNNVLMGSYGIGVSRLVGAIIEASADEHGMNFIKEVAPFTVIVNALSNKDDVLNKCEEIYSYLKNNNVEVIYNDKNDSLKNKLYYANLLGFPFQINIGNRSIKNNKFEFITRNNMKSEEYDFNKLNTLLTVLQ